jgi:hypothetical protein
MNGVRNLARAAVLLDTVPGDGDGPRSALCSFSGGAGYDGDIAAIA